MPEHEFSFGNPRCIHCGTLYERHLSKPQPCVPRWTSTEKLRPEPALRPSCIDAIDEIHARILELRAEDTAALNRADQEGGVQH